MEGIGPELPLQRSTRFGNYGLLTSYRDQIEQNFKIFANSIHYASFLTHTTRHFPDKSLENSIFLKPL